MTSRTLAIGRAVGVIGATATLVMGITFANLQSTATLSNNTISSATAGLELNNGTGFAQNVPGFTITNLVPGTESGGFAFDIRNTGAVPLNITAHVPATPSYSGFVPGGFSNVHIIIKKLDNTVVLNTTLAALLAGDESAGAPLSPLGGNATENLKAVVNIDPSAVNGSSASIGSFDIVFTGTQPN